MNRPGMAAFDVMVRPNGTIVWFALIRSSGFPDSDRVLLAELNGIAAFPALPSELLEPNDMPTRLSFTLPLSALGRSR